MALLSVRPKIQKLSAFRKAQVPPMAYGIESFGYGK